MKTVNAYRPLCRIFLFMLTLMLWNCSSSADLILPANEDNPLKLKSGKMNQSADKTEEIQPTYTFNEKEVELKNSQKEVIGLFVMYTESSTGNIFVEVTTTGGWVMNDIQLYIGEKNNIPSKGSVKLNYEWYNLNEALNPAQSTYLYEYVTGALQEYAIVFRSDVDLLDSNGQVIQSDVAWANDNNQKFKGNYYFTYTRLAGAVAP